MKAIDRVLRATPHGHEWMRGRMIAERARLRWWNLNVYHYLADLMDDGLVHKAPHLATVVLMDGIELPQIPVVVVSVFQRTRLGDLRVLCQDAQGPYR